MIISIAHWSIYLIKYKNCKKNLFLYKMKIILLNIFLCAFNVTNIYLCTLCNYNIQLFYNITIF